MPQSSLLSLLLFCLYCYRQRHSKKQMHSNDLVLAQMPVAHRAYLDLSTAFLALVLSTVSDQTAVQCKDASTTPCALNASAAHAQYMVTQHANVSPSMISSSTLGCCMVDTVHAGFSRCCSQVQRSKYLPLQNILLISTELLLSTTTAIYCYPSCCCS